jgi:O-antigen/teichoic acid export membrane protein
LSTLRKFAGQTAIYGLTTIVSRFLNFILTPIYVSVYPAKVYGILSTLFSYASLLNALLSFGMETTFFRYLNKYEGRKEQVYSNSFIVVAFLALSFLLFTLLFSGSIANYLYNEHVAGYEDYLDFVKYFIYILVVDALAVIPFAKLRADGRPGRYGLIKFLNILVFVLLNLFFIYVLPFMIKHDVLGASVFAGAFREGWVGYVFISNLLASIITLFMLLPELLKIRPQFDRKLFSEMFLYSWPVLIANISFIINENVDKIFLSELLPATISSQHVGIYSACAKVAVFLSIFIQAFRLGAEPFFFSHSRNANAAQTYARIMNFFIIAVSAIFIGLIANIEILKFFVKGKDAAEQAIYWSGLDVVPVLLFGYVCLGIYINLSVWYKLSDQTRFGLYISGIGAIITLVLNVIFIPRYSYMAAAWISLIAYATMMVISYLWGQKNYPIPYNIKKSVLYLSIAAIMGFVSYYILGRNLIAGNLFFVIFVLTALYLERKELSLIFRKG